MDNKIIKLKYSIPIAKEGGGTIQTNELTFGRIKAKHMKLLPSSFLEQKGNITPWEIIPFIAGLADIPESSADEIDLEDLEKVAEGIESFLSRSPENGSNSSGG